MGRVLGGLTARLLAGYCMLLATAGVADAPAARHLLEQASTAAVSIAAARLGDVART